MGKHEVVDINRLRPNPDNPNRVASHVFAKLRNNIERTGRYPDLICREVGSDLEIIDGEHRWRILKDLGYETVNIDNWGSVSDEDVALLLTTLNSLRGKDNKRKRASLLKMLTDTGDNVSDYVSETPEQISGLMDRMSIPVMRDDLADDLAGNTQSITLLVSPEMKRIISAAASARKAKGGLPGAPIPQDQFMGVYADYQLGRAITAVCEDWILSNVKE